MRRQHLYFTAGVLCLGISFCLYAYGRIRAVLTKPKASESITSPSQPAPTPQSVGTTRASRKREEVKTSNQNQESPALPTPTIWTPPVEASTPYEQPRVAASPTPDRERTVTSPPSQELTSQQCAERIEALDRGEYAYIPLECQDQYRFWRRYKSDQEREQRERGREAERQAAEQRRAREREKREQQERIERTTRTIRGVIQDIRRRRS